MTEYRHDVPFEDRDLTTKDSLKQLIEALDGANYVPEAFGWFVVDGDEVLARISGFPAEEASGLSVIVAHTLARMGVNEMHLHAIQATILAGLDSLRSQEVPK